MSTLYASFLDASAAESAAGALLDHGASAADISIVANEAYNSVRAVNANVKAIDAETDAKSGISTTTPGDVAVGAVKGAAIGLGVGAAAVLASVFVPGLGLVLGGGAIATALAGGAATVLAGSAAGGVVGYLVDQGVPEDFASRYNAHFLQGGAILAVAIPTGAMTTGEVEGMLVKYGAMNIATYNSSNVLIDDPAVQHVQVPLNVGNPNIDPIATTAAVAVDSVAAVPVETHTHEVIDAATGESRLVTTQVEATIVDPVTGVPTSAVAVDPLTQIERPVAVDPITGGVLVPPVAPITAPVTGVAIDPVTGLPINPVPATPVMPNAVVETSRVIVDPITGLEREVVEEEDAVVVRRKDVDLY
jgi:hypothetical protein